MDRPAARSVTDRALTLSELAQLVHDFKGPLSLVALETQVLQKQLLDDGAHVDMVDAMARVLLNVDYIDRMVHDLIDSCALDAGHFELHRTSTDLRDLLERVTSRMATSRDAGRIALHAKVSAILRIDALRIERVVANLLQNALTYSPVEAQVAVRLETSRSIARVSVRDGGPGLARHELARVFDEYQRSSGSYLHDGSGLGLYVSKKIVNAHGGYIGVTSTPGAGSEFYFVLPLV
jgi:signal transduction histidine kinase